MLRNTLAGVAATAILCALVYTRGHATSGMAFISANLPGHAEEVMSACDVLVPNEGAVGADTATAGVPTADTGKDTNPWYVQPTISLNTKTTMGGCKCGTAVCTRGRMCIEENSLCIIPPCPWEGLEGLEGGKKAVPTTYTAGCWCSNKANFNVYQDGVLDGTTPALTAPLFPKMSGAFADTKQAVICKVAEFCNAEMGAPYCAAVSK